MMGALTNILDNTGMTVLAAAIIAVFIMMLLLIVITVIKSFDNED